MAPYSLLYNRFHIKQCEIFDACIREEEDAKCRCWLVRDNTNCTASQMVFNFTKKNHYFNLFFSIEKLDFKCQHDKNYCLRDCVILH